MWSRWAGSPPRSRASSRLCSPQSPGPSGCFRPSRANSRSGESGSRSSCGAKSPSSRVVVGVPSASASPPRKAFSRRVQRAAGECHAAVTLPAGPEDSGPHFRDPQAGLPRGVWSARWAVPMEGGYLAFWRKTCVSRRKMRMLAERRRSAEKGFRFRLREIERLDRNRPRRLLLSFLVPFEFGFVGDRPPERFHPFVIILVAHRATFGPVFRGGYIIICQSPAMGGCFDEAGLLAVYQLSWGITLP